MTIESLKTQRANIRRNISRIRGVVDPNQRDEKSAPSQAELKCRLEILEAYFKQAISVQTQIEKECETDTGRVDLEDLYIDIKVCIKEQLIEEIHESTFAATLATRPPSGKLPKLALPTFAGNCADYKNFITLFNQLVDQQDSLSNIEKYNQLLSCLSGAALETVKRFQVTSENYRLALDRLKERYDNPTLVFLNNVSALFKLKNVTKSNCQEIRSLVDNATALYNSLTSLGSEAQIAQAMLIAIVMEKVDPETKREWNKSLDYSTLPTWKLCMQVVERHCQYLESLGKSESSQTRTEATGKPRSQSTSRHGSSFTCSTQSCALCLSTEHRVIRCNQFKDMTVTERYEAAKRLSLCLNCLGKGHLAAKCPSNQRCRTCSRLHHTLLHRETSEVRPSPSSSTSHMTTLPSDVVTHTHTNNTSDQVILATAIVQVRDASGNYKIGRALLDSCSQVNFISERFAQSLRLPMVKRHMRICSIGESHTQIKFGTSATIKSRLDKFEMPIDFCVTSHIAYQPDSDIDISSWNLPKNTPLADDQFNKTRHIDLLIGTEIFFEILAVGQIKLGPCLPTLQKTLLGWIVSGRYEGSRRQVHSYSLSLEESINENLERLWRIDDLQKSIDKFTPEHRQCEQTFKQTVHQQSDGRIVVRLPFKDDPSQLGSSYESAKQRFEALERRFYRNPELKTAYIEFLREYEELNHMSLVNGPRLDQPHNYIPHHCVVKLNSTSTKLRVVFDASSRTSSQRSLNDLLMVGPTNQNDLYTLLLRFRTFRYAITADVVKMFRQVLVDPRDRKYQYILWRETSDQPLRTYELNTVTYGTATAPYLAIRSMTYLADLHMNTKGIGAQAIKSSFYVDDFLCGHNTAEGLLKEEVTEILGKGKFQLAKWHSNHPDFVDDNTIKDLNLMDDSVTSALGLSWNQREDVLLFAFRPKRSFNEVTKRTILSLASSLFDPLGLVAPVIVTAKIILQELWILKLHWDESVPQALCQAWKSFAASLPALESLAIPRFCLQSNNEELQLHGFCDASIRAYGCCIYARTISSNGKIRVRLVTSKCRVAPTRKLSLPKLELAAAHLLAQLYVKIKGIFIVLHWIQQHSATLSTFVGNRVSDIQESTLDCHWRHVPTQHNPADLVSKGCPPGELVDSIWFLGPEFLSQSPSAWPKDKRSEPDLAVVALEKRKSAFKATTIGSYLLESIRSISSHRLSLRIVAWMMRFNYASRKIIKFDTPSPTPQELQRAFHCIIWNLQQQHFTEEIHALRKNRQISNHIKFLNPFLQLTDGFLLLKVGGRLELANVSMDHKHPILLPSKDDFVRHYVQFLHRHHYHAGPKALVALLRLQFWIVNARDLARTVVRGCVHCVRYKPKLQQQLMGNLPVERLTPSRPFAHCGVDFCGPVNVYLRIRGKAPSKSYIAIFVCFATKAVHIEMSAKGLMARSLMNARCTFEELVTITAEVEAILNSRPLTPLSSDPSDLGALTPGHFLTGDSLRALPEQEINDEQLKSLDRWRLLSGIKQNFWRRWLADYFNELHIRSKWTKSTPSISIGDMVLIHEDNVPSQKWIMGRITATVPGRDQRVRVVDVRTNKVDDGNPTFAQKKLTTEPDDECRSRHGDDGIHSEHCVKSAATATHSQHSGWQFESVGCSHECHRKYGDAKGVRTAAVECKSTAANYGAKQWKCTAAFE
ncbi:hypothetical protein ACLKA7_001255 [Drosophila subpalustris]